MALCRTLLLLFVLGGTVWIWFESARNLQGWCLGSKDGTHSFFKHRSDQDKKTIWTPPIQEKPAVKRASTLVGLCRSPFPSQTPWQTLHPWRFGSPGLYLEIQRASTCRMTWRKSSGFGEPRSQNCSIDCVIAVLIWTLHSVSAERNWSPGHSCVNGYWSRVSVLQRVLKLSQKKNPKIFVHFWCRPQRKVCIFQVTHFGSEHSKTCKGRWGHWKSEGFLVYFSGRVFCVHVRTNWAPCCFLFSFWRTYYPQQKKEENSHWKQAKQNFAEEILNFSRHRITWSSAGNETGSGPDGAERRLPVPCDARWFAPRRVTAATLIIHE